MRYLDFGEVFFYFDILGVHGYTDLYDPAT
jgi:hypothetical protein